MPMFENFTKTVIKTSGAEIVTVKGGDGPPLLLMHGNPFNHLSWHKIAPRLAKEFTVVCTDLRGYGDSSKPPGGGDHSNYSFRAMAQDQIEVMETLGFTKFYAAGHDRGARVLHRMCLDHPTKVLKAGFMDMLPQHYLLNNVTRQWGKFSWHWFFMVQDYPTPETMMGADPEFFIRRKLSKTDQGTSFFGPEALQDYIRCIRNPEVIHAMCEDYRATFGIDLDMDTADYDAGKRVTTPSLILWGAKGGVGRNHNAAEVWNRYATNIVRTATVPSGHYLQEECPDETYEALSSFFRP
ncbi:alpha/beta fold hydrolase [Paraburkholderia humisilvae]|uniref:Fluoroacetate dehalogenase n=1 Tax=Paraburkholderia humisilvae TaxID=627669 RepID=A0A6J5CWI0_9BURK|nr:alpha/beta hydrolase [Paraburkholderia humisilvae]CAB3746318.1 Fluoroacetate dehalogenase [Paraburkholderia humisilvae]